MIEIIGMSVEDALRIEEGGAHRIELVQALSEGGLTPSSETIKRVVQAVELPVNVIIRPHSKSFVYEKSEIAAMKYDIKMTRDLGGRGVVLGVLDEQGFIDERVLEELIIAAEGLDITFHRAIDEMLRPEEGIKILAKYKEINSVLTSGGIGELRKNLDRIKEMKRHCGHIEIMVGGGLNFENLEQVMLETGVNWLHFGRAVRRKSTVEGDIDVQAIRKAVELDKFGHGKTGMTTKPCYWR